MLRRPRNNRRRGAILPLVVVCLIALFGMVALAIDIGVIALARNQCQNAADIAAMAGVRQLTGDQTTNNNYNAVDPTAKAAATANDVLGNAIDSSKVTVSIGYYAYNSTAQRFDPVFTGNKPPEENWSAVKVDVEANHRTFFAKIFNINAFDAGATATAVHRPRDIALILDYSGSMKYSSEPAYPSSGTISGSLNPDTRYPKFGHWSAMSGVMTRTTLYVDGGGETHAPNNFTVETQNGPPIVLDFLTRDGTGNLTSAFNRATVPYDASVGATPAPADWDLQSDSTATYVGDKWPCLSLSFSGTYAKTAQEFLEGNNTNPSGPPYTNAKSTRNGPGGGKFEPANPLLPQDNEGYGPNFKGYSMGPGYYGKTFFMWPPDPRYHVGANPTAPDTSNSVKDNSGKWMGDWRKRFFFLRGTTLPVDDNSALWDSSGNWKQAGQSGSYDINYSAVIQWIKLGPKVFPDNLRAGRVLYYSQIPDSLPATGGSEDQRFWRAYIDYVIGAGSTTVQQQTLYGRHTTAWGTVRITAKSNVRGPNNLAEIPSPTSDDPYMHYTDNPLRPRGHFWFGPQTMLCFLSDNNNFSYARNWMPGTSHESQCWQLKAGVQSALKDIEKNHPNDWVSLIHFSGLQGYTTERVPLGREYTKMKNALFFPFNTLNNLSDPNFEVRPYNSTFGDTAAGNVPNAAGSTSPECGFKVAYNQLSSRSGFNGRRGAAKVVIFETDGVPNTECTASFVNGGAYNSMYSNLTVGFNVGNNNSTVVNNALATVDRLCALDTANPSGYSSAKVPARVHAIGFGDLFQSGSAAETNARTFLLNVQKRGKTSPSSATAIESYKIITGDYNTRIENLRQALERIMQSGVQVSLIR